MKLYLCALFLTLFVSQSFSQETCNEGGFKSVGCNRCYCRSGQWSCTKIDCSNQASISNKECTHGSVKMESCNKCDCMYGHWACTNKNCRGVEGQTPSVPNWNTQRPGYPSSPYDQSRPYPGPNPGYPSQPSYPGSANGYPSQPQYNQSRPYPGPNPGYPSQPSYPGSANGYPSQPQYNQSRPYPGSVNGYPSQPSYNQSRPYPGSPSGYPTYPQYNQSRPYPGSNPPNYYPTSTPNYYQPNQGPGLYPKLPECVDGQTKMNDCNRCTCMGGNWACTQRDCRISQPGVPASGNQNFLSLNDFLVNERCTDGQNGKHNCNFCLCSKSKWVCTPFDCSLSRSKRDLSTETCREGGFKTISCNQCYCRSGSWSCTKIDCANPSIRNTKECTHGSVKTESCNTCNCMYGHWACTMKNCGSSGYTQPPSQIYYPGPTYNGTGNFGNYQPSVPSQPIPSSPCSIGETRKVDCEYQCNCPSGRWACISDYCPPGQQTIRPQYPTIATTIAPYPGYYPNQQECSQGQTKKHSDGCNTCTCLGGRWACTQKECIAQPAVILLTRETVGQSCTSSLPAKYDCNDCQCLGGYWACTTMRC